MGRVRRSNRKRIENQLRIEDLKMEDPWRVFRIMGEFVDGFHADPIYLKQ